jgi:phosphate-selective porin OprO/OprP
MKKLFLLLPFFYSSFGYSQTIVDSKFGKGLMNVIAEDSSWSMKLGFRIQTLFIGDWNINDTEGIESGNSEALIRRSRLKFGGFAFSPKVQYKIELGLSNKDLGGASQYTNGAPRLILDAVVKWNFYKNLTLWAGQTKLPGNRERVISSANLQFVDRSLLNSNFNIDRDVGIQIRNHHTVGKQFLIREMYSISSGEGRNIVGDNLGGYKHTARVEILPFGKFISKGDFTGGDTKREESPKLSLAATYDYHDRAVKNKSNQGSYMVNDQGLFETNITTVFIDAMFKYKGFSIMSEYANRASENPLAINSDGSLTGAEVGVGFSTNFQLGYLLKSNWEFAGRYTTVNWDKTITGKESQNQYTFGASKYIVGHKLKVQSDLSYLTTNNSSDSNLMYRMQFELHF